MSFELRMELIHFLLFLIIGGAMGSMFFSKRYTAGSGLNSPNLDFFPIQNIEDMDIVLGALGAVPVGK
jgi:hypothetical protein